MKNSQDFQKISIKKEIKTYQDLVDEQKRLEALLKDQKELVQSDVEKVKLKVKPYTEIARNVKKFTPLDGAILAFSLTSDMIVNTLFKKIIVARTGWLGKLVLPYLFKKYSHSFLKEQKDKFVSGVRSVVKNKGNTN